jgi:uncharacterized membrane protein
LKAIIAAALAIVSGWSVASENFISLLIAIVLAMTLLYFFNKSTREITQDERTSALYTRASRSTIALTVPLAAIVSVLLIAFKEHLPEDVVVASYTLAYFSCVILLVHSAFYSYYNRKS